MLLSKVGDDFDQLPAFVVNFHGSWLTKHRMGYLIPKSSALIFQISVRG
tara:strand:- start:304 stop:450 length:147 start_codon:yes stop_codon:yes gene_type:complete